MKNSFLILFLFILFILSGMFSQDVLAGPVCEACEYDDPYRCLHECWSSCPYSEWYEISDGQCAGDPGNICCRGDGCSSPCGPLKQWEWCYATGCYVMYDEINPGVCLKSTNYSHTGCAVTDSCNPGETGLRSGLCVESGCSVGGIYKTCCSSTGQLQTCEGGQNSGTCPEKTVMCGWGGNPDCGQTACNTLIAAGPPPTPAPGQPTPAGTCPADAQWCTGPDNCRSNGGTPIEDNGWCSEPADQCCRIANSNPAPPPPPPSSCGGDCAWYQNQDTGCGWCTDEGTCMSSGMCAKSWDYSDWCQQGQQAPQGRCCGCQGNPPPPPPCYESCSCAVNTCSTATCTGNCGTTCHGTKCCLVVLSSPGLVSPTSGIIHSQYLDLVWRPPSSWGNGCPDQKSFQVYYGTAYPPTGWVSESLPESQTTKHLSNPEEGSYYWQVKAVNQTMSKLSGIAKFTVKYNYDPWWQTKDGDVHSNEEVVTYIPDVCGEEEAPDCRPYLSLAGEGGSPGLVSYKEDGYWGAGAVSETGWKVKEGLRRGLDFDYLKNRLNIDPRKTLPDCSAFDCPFPQESGSYYRESAGITYLKGGDVCQKKILLFIDGDVEVTGNITIDRDLGCEGFFALITTEDLRFAPAVTKAHGFFLAEGNLIIKSLAVPAKAVYDSQFVGEGSFVTRGEMIFRRNLGERTLNKTTPAELFISRPDLYINIPPEFTWKPFVFRELAP